jgi:predicted phage replisome organizer/uncharacterized phage protein (TIGR02220 family)
MADVKWIKVTTDIFDDEKILLIESMPERDSLIVIWFKLLCMAGKQNNSGVFMLNDRIAYTDEMLSTIFRRPLNTIRLALQTFEQFGMIEIIDHVITIPNWGKHQNLDQLETKKNYMKNYMKNYREKQKSLTCKTNSKTNSKTNVSQADKDIDKEEDKDKDKERDIDIDSFSESTDSVKIPYQRIVDLFNSICISYPRVKSLSEARKKAIKARFKNGYRIEDFEICFNNAENSGFLKGKNNKNWSANFDWLIKDANMAKVLDGNYNAVASETHHEEKPQSEYDRFMRDLQEIYNESE